MEHLWIGRGLTGAAGILILATLWAWFHENLAQELVLAALLVWGSALGVIWLWLKRRVQRRVMPLLAGALGLTFETPAHRHAEALPASLLPKGLRTGEYRLYGRIADRDISLAEVRVDRSDTDTDPPFKGIVMEVESVLPIPDFVLTQIQLYGLQPLLEPQDESFASLKQAKVIRHGEVTYGIYTAQDATLDDAQTSVLRAALVGLPAEVSRTAWLFSARFCGGKLIVAIQTPRQLFVIGNLLANQDEVAQSLQSAFEEVSIPVALLGKVLEAEAELAQEKRRGEAPAPVLLP